MSLFAALRVSAEALNNYQRALANVENNVVNASTPGFARQTQGFLPRLFEPEQGVMGGAELAPRQNLRSQFAEQGVRRQNSLFGRYAQLQSQLSQIEAFFDGSGQSGIPAALSRLFDSFSNLALNPNDPVARQNVLEVAGQVANAFQSTSAALRDSAVTARREVAGLVDHINTLAAKVREYNASVRQDSAGSEDPGLDAQVHAALEELAGYADINVIRQEDRSFTVLLGGQTALVTGDSQYSLAADLSLAQPVVRDADGRDITSQVGGGQLAGALHAANTLIPAFQSDLHRLAQSVADVVNATLAAGVDLTGQPGAALFSYNQPSDAASTLAVTGITAAQIAAAAAAAPGGNGNALALSRLGTGPQINGSSFAAFFGQLTARIGYELHAAREGAETQRALVSQSRALRNQIQGVSLDEEAVHLVELQRAYEATARFVTALDELTQTTIDMLR